MRGRALAPVVVALAVAAVVAVVVLAVSGGQAPELAPPPGDPVALATSVTPHRLFPGDVASAVVEVTVDNARVDPAKVEVAAVFRPFYRAGAVVLERSELGQTTILRFRYRLQCVVRACAPGRLAEPVDLPIGLVRYAPREGAVVSLPLDWPPIELVTRLEAGDFRSIAASPSALAGEVERSLASASPRGGPLLLGWLLVGAGAILLLAVAGMLGRALWPAPAAGAQEEEVEILGPLEAAIGAAEASLTGTEEGRRAAFAELARRLTESDREAMSVEARRLAWSAEGPSDADARSLLASLRHGLPGADGGEA